VTTIIRLVVLLPAAAFMALLGVLTIGFAGWSFFSIAIAAFFVGSPIVLIVWTIRDHRHRTASRDSLKV
jgi:Flp pilus assembly protein TadB